MVKIGTNLKNFKSPMARPNIGKIGEKIGEKYLKEKGFTFIDRNFNKKCGEINLVFSKDDTLYFVEVKTLSRSIMFSPIDKIYSSKILKLEKNIMRSKNGDFLLY